MPADLSRLRAHLARNPEIRRVIAAIPQARMRGNITSAQNIALKIGDRYASRQNFNLVIQTYRALQDSGLGQLRDSTVRQRARFVWSVLPAAVALAIETEHGTISPTDYLTSTDRAEAQAQASAVPAIDPTLREHRFELRPGLHVVLHLPKDFTPAEATRLGHLLHALAIPAE